MAGPAAPTRPRARAARDVSTHARTAASRVTSRYVAFGRETQNGGAEGAGFRAGLRERSALIRSALIIPFYPVGECPCGVCVAYRESVGLLS